ncbi:MAG: YIP1 family protein [Gemmatimonadaceae bacterium]|nr:YIP1 family protein [Gemmatimonadaceae bacterium]
MTEPALTPAVPQASLWEDFVDIFTSPSQVFRRRESSGFGLQLLVLTVVFALIVLGTKSLVQPAIDAEMARQGAHLMKSHPEITLEQLQKQRAMGEKLGPIFVVLAIPISAMLTGLVLWLVGKIFDSKQTATAAIMVATYAFFPKILASVAGAIIALLSSPERLNGMARVTVGLGALFDPDTASPVLMALVTRLDVFTLWETALLAIGLQVTGKVSKSSSYLAAAIVWVIGALPALLGALRS